MPVTQPITGVHITASPVLGAVTVRNAQQGILWATIGSVSGTGKPLVYAGGTVLNTGNLAWDTTGYTVPLGSNVCLPFGTTQVIFAPSLRSA